MDFAVLADHRIKLKECEKKDKYLDFARKLKKLWNMKVIIIRIVIGAFDTLTKGCWVVHMPFIRMVKFQFLAHLPVNRLAHPAVSSLILLP